MPDNGEYDDPTEAERVRAMYVDEYTRRVCAQAEAERLRTALEAIHRIAAICNATEEWVEPRAILRLADLALEQR